MAASEADMPPKERIGSAPGSQSALPVQHKSSSASSSPPPSVSGATDPLPSATPQQQQKQQLQQQQQQQPPSQQSQQQQQSQQSQQPQPQQQPPLNTNQQKVTVETETVPSVATLGVNPHSTLRVKRSQDSVPRFNSTKGATKRRSLRLAQGSKADIFAAKVANAVEEQDSSDDETFVYQAPITSSHATESLRRPYMRSSSNSSFHPTPSGVSLHQGDGYFGDSIPQFDSESDAGSGFPPKENYDAANIEADDTPVSPTKSLTTLNSQQTLQNPAQLYNSSHQTSSQKGLSQPPLPQQQHPSSSAQQSPRNFVVQKQAKPAMQPHTPQYPPYLQSSSSSSVVNAPFQYAQDTDGTSGYDEMRDLPWSRNSQRNGRSRVYSTNEFVSPIKDPNDSIRAKHLYLQRWRVPSASTHSQSEDIPSDEALDERASLLRGRPSLYNYQSSRNSYGRRQNNNPLTLNQHQLMHQPSHLSQSQQQNQKQQQQQNRQQETGRSQGYLSDAEYSPTDSTFSKLHASASFSTRIMIAASLTLIMLLSLVFVGGILLAAARPLRNFDVVALSDVLVSDRELVFSMITRARNPGMFSRVIDHGELDIFATSSHTSSEAMHGEQQTRTVLLGTITELESPMLFRGGLSSPTQWRSASAKLVSPLANNTAMWSEISSYEFDLTVKGILMYSILGGEHRETVSRTYHVMSPKYMDGIHTML